LIDAGEVPGALLSGSTYRPLTTANMLMVNTSTDTINTVNKRVIVFMASASMALQDGMLSILHERIVTGM